MTTLAALVAAAPAATRGVQTRIPGGWRLVFELADPGAGSAVEWYDVTCDVLGWQNVRGADQYAGRYRASVVDVDFQGDDDTFAPWNPDTSPIAGTNVKLGVGLLLRGGFIRVAESTVLEWLPRFTNKVEYWGDASYARGIIRRFPVIARDLLQWLVGRPVPASSEQNWSERVDYILTQTGWPYGWTVYGATFDTGVDVLTVPARPAATSALSELAATLDPAGLVYYTDRTGRIIIRPAVWDTFHADAFTGGADGTPFPDPGVVTFHYLAEDDAGGILGYAAYASAGTDPFGFPESQAAVMNHLVVAGPGGTFDDDDPISIQRHDPHDLQVTWIADNNQAAGDLLTYRANAVREAVPLYTSIDLHGFMPGPAELDYLGYVAIDHQTREGRAAVFGNGWVRQYTERGAPRGDLDDTSWELTITIDVYNVDVNDTLLPVEDLLLVDVTDTSAEFSWTNPTQTITPTHTQIRVRNPASLWATVDYPITGIVWGGLEPSTGYTFDVRLIRVVDGLITDVSPSESWAFTTDPTTVPDIDGVGDDGDTDVDFPPPGDGCDTIDWELQESDDGETGWTMIESGTITEAPWTVTIPDVVYFADKFYRIVADACGDVTISNLYVGACTDPPAMATAPFDDPDCLFYFPAICPPDILVEAFSEDPATKGYAYAGFAAEAGGNIVLVAGGEGVVAYGANPVRPFDETIAGLVGDATLACKVHVQNQPDADVILFSAAGLRLHAVANGANWSVDGEIVNAGGGVTHLVGVTPLDFGVWYDVAITHDTTSGDVILYVDGNDEDTAAGLSNNRHNPGGYGCGVPAASLITNCAVWDRVLADTELPGYVAPPPPVTVTINKGASQPDPTTVASIVFDVVFSEAVTGFATGDVTLSGTAGGTLVGTVAGTGATYTVTVTGMTTTGTVVATIAASVCTSVATSVANDASTSTDNSVQFNVIYTDNFNRANGGLGSNWTPLSGTLAIVSNAVHRSGAEANAYWYLNPVPMTDYYVELTIVQYAASSLSGIYTRFGGAVANNPAGNGYVQFAYEKPANRWYIGKASGVVTASATAPTAPFRIRIEVWNDGSTTRIRGYQYVSGSPSLVINADDTAANRSTGAGRVLIFLGSNATDIVDDFEIGPH